jgi:hypothetical protein
MPPGSSHTLFAAQLRQGWEEEAISIRPASPHMLFVAPPRGDVEETSMSIPPSSGHQNAEDQMLKINLCP